MRLTSNKSDHDAQASKQPSKEADSFTAHTVVYENPLQKSVYATHPHFRSAVRNAVSWKRKKLTVDKTDRQIEMDEKQGGEKGKREGKKDSSIADKTINPHGASNHHPH